MILDNSRQIWRPWAAAAAATIGLALGACGGGAETASHTTQAAPDARLRVVVTFSTLAAIVKDVGGSFVDVTAMVPVGAAPETFEPTPSDLVALSHADVVFENGSGLETWMDKLLRSAGNGTTPVVLSGISDPARAQNPHFWLDPREASTYAERAANALELADAGHAAGYRANLAATKADYAALDRWIAAQIATIPPDRRAMICFHDAWYYFDRRYGIRDVGAVEPSPGQEPSAGAFAQLIAAAKANNVRAVFAEPQFSPKLAKQLAEGAGIATVTDLYDDTLGTTAALSTYDGMMRYDVARIVEALKS